MILSVILPVSLRTLIKINITTDVRGNSDISFQQDFLHRDNTKYHSQPRFQIKCGCFFQDNICEIPFFNEKDIGDSALPNDVSKTSAYVQVTGLKLS